MGKSSYRDFNRIIFYYNLFVSSMMMDPDKVLNPHPRLVCVLQISVIQVEVDANGVLESMRAQDTGTHLDVCVEGVLKLQSGEPPYLYHPRPQLNLAIFSAVRSITVPHMICLDMSLL
jgi:hypothetical protein